MKINYKKKFKKSFSKFQLKIQQKAIFVLDIFIKNPNSKILRRHSLKGKYSNYESIDVTGDIRIIIQPKTKEIIDICDIGTHSKLY